jgi:hypothetical protein
MAWAQEKKVFGNSGYPWAAPEYKGDKNMVYTIPENIAKVAEQNINLQIKESYTDEDIAKVVKAIDKVCEAYAKN